MSVIRLIFFSLFPYYFSLFIAAAAQDVDLGHKKRLRDADDEGGDYIGDSDLEDSDPVETESEPDEDEEHPAPKKKKAKKDEAAAAAAEGGEPKRKRFQLIEGTLDPEIATGRFRDPEFFISAEPSDRHGEQGYALREEGDRYGRESLIHICRCLSFFPFHTNTLCMYHTFFFAYCCLLICLLHVDVRLTHIAVRLTHPYTYIT